METTPGPGVVPIVEDDQLYDWGIENRLTDYQYCQVGGLNRWKTYQIISGWKHLTTEK